MGEPLLHPELGKILDTCAQLDFRAERIPVRRTSLSFMNVLPMILFSSCHVLHKYTITAWTTQDVIEKVVKQIEKKIDVLHCAFNRSLKALDVTGNPLLKELVCTENSTQLHPFSCRCERDKKSQSN